VVVGDSQSSNKSIVGSPTTRFFTAHSSSSSLPGAHYHSQVDANEKDTTTQQQHKKIPREPVVVVTLEILPHRPMTKSGYVEKKTFISKYQTPH
jgi:hypothetical protein